MTTEVQGAINGSTHDSANPMPEALLSPNDTIAALTADTSFVQPIRSAMRNIPSSVAEPLDVIHDAALRMMERGTAATNARAYLNAATRNQIIDINDHERVIKRKRGQRVPLEDAVTVASQTNIEDQVQARLQRTVVIAALGQLTERQRQVLTLRYYGGYSEAQIAERLGITRGTVKSTASLGKATLRKIMGTNPNSDA